MREHRPPVTRQDHPTVASVVVVTLDAMPVEDRLDVAGEIRHVGAPGIGSMRLGFLRPASVSGGDVAVGVADLCS